MIIIQSRIYRIRLVANMIVFNVEYLFVMDGHKMIYLEILY